jgi:hypothetical protein
VSLGSMPGSPGVPLPRGPVQPPNVTIPSPSSPPRLQAAPPLADASQNGNPTAVQTGMTPGTQQNVDAAGQRLASDTDALTQYPTRVQPLLEAIKVAPNAGVGPGSDKINQVASFLQSRGVNVGLTPDMSSTAAYDLLQKNLAKYARAIPGANNSEGQLASAISANPHATMNTLGLHDALVQTLAQERMQAALRKNYNGPLNGPAYQQYLQQQSTTVDPRAFAHDQLTPAQQKNIFSGMTSKTEQTNYINSLNMARQTGVMTNNAFPAPQ